MRRVLVPGLLAIALVVTSSANASAFGLFGKSFHRGCDAGCEPVCGCEVAYEPVCGCEVVDPCCPPKKGLLHKLFHRHHSPCCAPEPVCGCEPVCEPVCGCEPICEPACGFEPACCDAPCGKKRPFRGFFHRMFHRSPGCCDVVEPVCGCEPACGFEVAPSCGCGH